MISINDDYLITFNLIPMDISRMNWNKPLLCGISATGDIFKFSGILMFIAFHLITVAKKWFIFSKFSFMRVASDIFVFAEMWGPRMSDKGICGTVQFGAQYIGHPLPEYLSRIFIAGQSRACPVGIMSWVSCLDLTSIL